MDDCVSIPLEERTLADAIDRLVTIGGLSFTNAEAFSN